MVLFIRKCVGGEWFLRSRAEVLVQTSSMVFYPEEGLVEGLKVAQTQHGLSLWQKPRSPSYTVSLQVAFSGLEF